MRAATERTTNGAPADPARTLSSHLAAIGTRLARVARIRAARRGVWLNDALFLALGGVVLALGAAMASVAGVWLAVRGLTGGLAAALDGRPWLAELFSGLILLSGTALLFVTLHAWLERRIVRKATRPTGGGDGTP